MSAALGTTFADLILSAIIRPAFLHQSEAAGKSPIPLLLLKRGSLIYRPVCVLYVCYMKRKCLVLSYNSGAEITSLHYAIEVILMAIRKKTFISRRIFAQYVHQTWRTLTRNHNVLYTWKANSRESSNIGGHTAPRIQGGGWLMAG